MKTLLVITPNKNTSHDATFHLLVAETGEHLASHYCSHGGFADYDLYESRAERIAEYAKRFGKVEVKFLEDTNISKKELQDRNHKWFEEMKNRETH